MNIKSNLETTFTGLKLRSPIGVGAVGRPFGANLTPKMHAEVLLKHVDAGVSYIYLPPPPTSPRRQNER